MITYDDFKKVELRIATVLSAERIPGSDKLLRLEVNAGEEKRQIVAGIGKNHRPEDLLGRQIVIVANLEPRQLMGLESQGMLLAASVEESGPILLTPETKIDAGAEIR